VEVESEIDAFLLEANFIRKYQPKYNSELKDNANYPLIEITLKDPIPTVKIVRLESNPKAVYFGPYPLGSDVSRYLRYLRKIFPFVSQKHQKNTVCFRFHLGLCPCGNLVTPQGKRTYRTTLRHLINFLSGKRQIVQKQLQKEMNEAFQNEDFITAGEIKNHLDKMAWITAPRLRAFEYETNPVLVEERRSEEVSSLENVLGINEIHRIECYDISNTSGKLATASMVVFVDGQKTSSEYRHFRIKFVNRPGDVLMMEETLRRRFKSKGIVATWPKPDLIVVDGGAGQLSVARKVLTEYNLSIPTISLAKREEEIYIQTDIKLKLPDDSPALRLIKKMRDEAHRFSRRYHFLLRDKQMLS